jgi:DNA (cytosine-5)-methyltransferase 1
MKVLSLFSGVGGFDLGLERAGMETVFQCEWDKHATKILERHWPNVPRWDDIATLTGAHILQHAPVIDVVAWGSPCQDLSVAGKRAGLDGARSGLFHQGIRIIKELRELTNGKYPRFSIWENVAGALSSAGGADFGQVLYEMDEAGACFSEWRLLDAQYFGVPQRRRRVFVVSVFDSGTAARCPDPLLPLSEGVRGDSSTGEPSREAVAGEVANCLRVGSGVGERGDGTDNLVLQPSFRMRGFGDYTEDATASALKSRDHKDATDLVLQEPILIDRAAYNQGQNAQFDIHISDDPVSPSLVARGPHAVATFTKGKRAQTVADDETWDEGRPAPTLNAFDQGDTRATTLIVKPQTAVRRLTPVECERLMGWPDGWTEGQADTHRYKQCGNGVASPVAEWIGKQIIHL